MQRDEVGNRVARKRHRPLSPAPRETHRLAGADLQTMRLEAKAGRLQRRAGVIVIPHAGAAGNEQHIATLRHFRHEAAGRPAVVVNAAVISHPLADPAQDGGDEIGIGIADACAGFALLALRHDFIAGDEVRDARARTHLHLVHAERGEDGQFDGAYPQTGRQHRVAPAAFAALRADESVLGLLEEANVIAGAFRPVPAE